MGFKSLNIILLLIISAFTLSTCSTCKIMELGCDKTIYTFQIGVKAYPDKDSVQVGDTIWFEINEPVSFTDINTNDTVNYSGAVNLGSALGFGRYIKINDAIEAANDFDYILISGSEVPNPNTSQIREFLFIQQSNHYIFKLGIIPKDTGVFGVGFSNAQNVYRNNNKCTKADFLIHFKNTNQHFYLNPNISGTVELPEGSYFFKVY